MSDEPGRGTASGVVVREATAADAPALVELRALMVEAMLTPGEQLAPCGMGYRSVSAVPATVTKR